MSDVLTSVQDWRIKDDKIVNGFVRDHMAKYNNLIPVDIINLCFRYYHHVPDVFRVYNPANYKLSNNNMTATRISGFSVCYGQIVIPSLIKIIHKWTFRIVIRASFMAIGIDDTRYIMKNSGGPYTSFRRESKRYFLWNDAVASTWNQDLQRVEDSICLGMKYEANDTVLMVLNLAEKSLSYGINDKPLNVVFKDVICADDISYSMAFYCQGHNDSITLLKYETE